MNISYYVNLVLKNWLLVVGISILCFAGGVGLCFVMPPIYQADGKLLITHDNVDLPGKSNSLDDIMLSSLGKSDPLSTQIEIMKTRPILNKVIDRLKLTDSKGVRVEPASFVKTFDFSLLRNTNLIGISCRYHDADTAALLVNFLATAYIINNREMNQEINAEGKKYIEEQLESQKNKVDESESALIEFKRRSNTVEMGKETNVNIDAYASLNTSLLQLNSELDAAENQKRIFTGKLSSVNAAQSPSYNNWLYLSEQADNAVGGLMAKKQAIKKQLDEQAKKLKGMPVTEIQMARLIREQQTAIEIYTDLLSKYEEYKVREGAKFGSAKLIEPAVAPLKPVAPMKKILIALSLLFGLSFGTAIVFAIDYVKEPLRSIAEIRNTLGYSFLGTIPYAKFKKNILFTRDQPRTLQAEAIRHIQTNIRHRLNSESCSVIVVTSAQPSEGKSLIAANLAYSISSSKKTLLLGMDFRMPSFEKIFNLDMSAPGIADIFDGTKKVNPQTFDNLHIMGPGTQISNPLDLVLSKRMFDFLAFLKTIYEVIIIDTAPINAVAETREIIKYADTVAVVVDITSTSLKQINILKNAFDSKGIDIGFIVNKYKYSNSNYYTKYYAKS